MISSSQFIAAPAVSLSLLDRAAFISISAMSVFALFSPLLTIGR
jgi:hypothetical protein